MATAIIGSRSFHDFGLLCNVCNDQNITYIISGGAKGADSLAIRFANYKKIPYLIYFPNYKKYGKKAPLIRNIEIIRSASKVIAFWNRKSTGTAHTLYHAKK